MRLFRQEHRYDHDWETVTAALWEKYPNPLQPHVTRVDTLDRAIDSNTHTFHCLRLLSLQYHIPSWVQTLLRRPTTTGYGLEEATCNVKDRTLTLKSKNVTFSHLLSIEETCEYRPDPTNPYGATLYTQQAEYRIVGLGYLSAALERAVVQSAGDKAKAGLQAMQAKIERLDERWKRADLILQSLEQNVQNFEQTLLDGKERLDKKFSDAKQKVEETVSKIEQCITGGTTQKPKSDYDDSPVLQKEIDSNKEEKPSSRERASHPRDSPKESYCQSTRVISDVAPFFIATAAADVTFPAVRKTRFGLWDWISKRWLQ